LPRPAPTAAPGRAPGVSAAMEAAEEAHCRLPYLLANGCIPIAPLPGVPPHDGWRLALRDIVPPPQPRRATLGERDRAARITSLVPSRLKTAARELRWDGAAPAR
jgi:hypothetical protein